MRRGGHQSGKVAWREMTMQRGETPRQTRLALDLGGTKLLVGEVDEDGRVLRHQAYASRGLDQAGALTRGIWEMAG